MKKVTIFTLVIILGLFGIFSAADARFGGEGKDTGKGSIGLPPGKWWKMPQVAEKLSLSKEEQEKMNIMYLEHRRQMIDLRSQVERERLEMEQLLDSETLNASACMDRFKKLQEVQNSLATERFKLLVQVRELLGLDRFQKLKEEFQHFRMERGHGKQGKQGKRSPTQGKGNPR